MTTKRIVLLANSRKHSGRCLAGREIVGNGYGAWIRPISARPGAEVAEDERQYEDGTDPKVLDIVDVTLLSAKPSDCHTENWVLDSKYYWVKRGELSWGDAYALRESPVKLWNSGSSTYAGLNDRIAVSDAAGFTKSITMIAVESIEIHIHTPGAAFGDTKKKVQARFQYRGTDYWLSVTDPVVERKYLAAKDTVHHLGPCLLTVSLAEPYAVKGVMYYFKLVAAIIEAPTA